MFSCRCSWRAGPPHGTPPIGWSRAPLAQKPLSCRLESSLEAPKKASSCRPAALNHSEASSRASSSSCQALPI